MMEMIWYGLLMKNTMLRAMAMKNCVKLAAPSHVSSTTPDDVV